ncbi:GNAT family N-acetyltransferase [Sphingomonas abaci]|uniref:Ribosomal protein S18 acetylase RimI-like enzyme n=1 Tax=Sphingomonas abaci TaxID=237611 RepID=A0A7W7AJW3_9SPHN|nr:ribosomal protein S18 acetylase RimI-like enzyme [Sphingomonas abaci]
MTEMLYRDAIPADAPAIRALFAASFTATFGHLYAPADLAAFLDPMTIQAWQAEIADPAYAFHLAEADGTLVGFIKLGPASFAVERRGPAIELRQFYVDAAYHGRGIAPAMMDWALATARDRGATEMFLSVYVDNARARRFYQRYGFERIGRYTFMVGDHADEDDIMRRTL